MTLLTPSAAAAVAALTNRCQPPAFRPQIPALRRPTIRLDHLLLPSLMDHPEIGERPLPIDYRGIDLA